MGPRVKRFCIDCRFFVGNITIQDREFLGRLLGQYDARLMIKSWAELGQTKIPGGRRLDPDKARTAEMLKHKGFCRKEGVSVSPVELCCVFYESAGRE